MQILILGNTLPLQTGFGLAFPLGHFQLKNEGGKRRDLPSALFSQRGSCKRRLRLKLQWFSTVHTIQRISLKRQAWQLVNTMLPSQSTFLLCMEDQLQILGRQTCQLTMNDRKAPGQCIPNPLATRRDLFFRRINFQREQVLKISPAYPLPYSRHPITDIRGCSSISSLLWISR